MSARMRRYATSPTVSFATDIHDVRQSRSRRSGAGPGRVRTEVSYEAFVIVRYYCYHRTLEVYPIGPETDNKRGAARRSVRRQSHTIRRRSTHAHQVHAALGPASRRVDARARRAGARRTRSRRPSCASARPSPSRTCAPRPTRRSPPRSRTATSSSRTGATRCSSRAPSSSPCSAATSRCATSRRPTSRKQIPAWSLMTSAYLFRDVDHLKKTFKSDVGREFIKMARDQLGIQVITPVYFGARHVNLKPDKAIKTPADLRRHQAAHAARRVLAVPRRVDRRQSDAGRVSPRSTPRCRPAPIDGQDNPLVAEPADEVLRGDHAVRAHRPRHRLRRDGGHQPRSGTR